MLSSEYLCPHSINWSWLLRVMGPDVDLEEVISFVLLNWLKHPMEDCQKASSTWLAHLKAPYQKQEVSHHLSALYICPSQLLELGKIHFFICKLFCLLFCSSGSKALICLKTESFPHHLSLQCDPVVVKMAVVVVEEFYPMCSGIPSTLCLWLYHIPSLWILLPYSWCPNIMSRKKSWSIYQICL